MLTLDDEYFDTLNSKGEVIINIVGCDEAGRGPLCGPVVASAVILPRNYNNSLLNDSKKLTSKNRELLFLDILNKALAYGIGYVFPSRIDEINIYNASKEAMLIALKNLTIKFPNIKIDQILTDYMPLNFLSMEAIPLAKGDAKVRAIAASSIIAKVCRDHYMFSIDKKYPNYKFSKHKGYPTKLHLELINKYGIINGFYRESYRPVKDYLDKDLKLFDLDIINE